MVTKICYLMGLHIRDLIKELLWLCKNREYRARVVKAGEKVGAKAEKLQLWTIQRLKTEKMAV